MTCEHLPSDSWVQGTVLAGASLPGARGEGAVSVDFSFQKQGMRQVPMRVCATDHDCLGWNVSCNF